jgi:Pregnancy-associated plasma protein-A/Secretion system C-terminal sorting domain
MANDPEYAKKVNELLKSKGNYSRNENKGRPPAQSSITIPVVVHVLYNTAEQNISDAQVQSQIDVLNEDFTATNSDYRNYDAGYGSVKGDMDINFCLVQVIHKQTKHKSFGLNDNMKFNKTGGSDAVDPMHVFNIWVCDLGNKLLGYAYYPGIAPEKFGVVCHVNAFGRGAAYNLFTDYDLGRTTTHEVGHAFGLAHIWGDRTCGSDEVDDTPLHNTYNFGCPEEGHLSTCTGTPLEMWMNYMDYTDDRCMYFFTDGQTSRASYFIDTDPQLNSIVNSACTNTRENKNKIITSSKIVPGPSRLIANKLVLYPSVTSGQLNLTFTNSVNEKAEINIYNQTGALMMKHQVFISSGKNIDQIDVSKLGNGIYFLELGQGANRQTKKFIVQH